jgi:thymidylate synthase
MNSENIQVINNNLSVAWAESFLESIKPGVTEIRPLTITITGFENGIIPEIIEIRNILDASLSAAGKYTSATTANTIFPISLWNPKRSPQELYDRYNRILPILKRLDRHNMYGLYFERLIAYGDIHHNQLEYIIKTYKSGNHRRSALQASIFDPLKDQKNQRQRGFPCLQQIAFIPNSELKEMDVHGFYATQYLYERAYGNLLGIARLGYFVAHELEFKLARVHCTASIAKYGNVQRSNLRELEDNLFEIIKKE